MRKRNFTSFEVLAEQVRKTELHIFASQDRAEVREQNFTHLAVKAERKCGSGTSDFWQSMQNESADVELQIFGSQGRAEMLKRNIRSLAVKAEQKCGSGISARALGNTGLNPFLGPSCRVKKSPSSRLVGPLGSFVPAVFGRDVCLMSGSLSHVS